MNFSGIGDKMMIHLPCITIMEEEIDASINLPYKC